MYKVVIFSTLRNVSKSFAKRHHLRFHLSRFSTAFREFSSLSDAQDFAFSLLGHVKRDFCVYLANEKHDVLCIYQEGW